MGEMFDFNAAIGRDKEEKASIEKSLHGSPDYLSIDTGLLHEDLVGFAAEYGVRGENCSPRNGGKGWVLRVPEGELAEARKAAIDSGMPLNTIALIGLRWATAHADEIEAARGSGKVGKAQVGPDGLAIDVAQLREELRYSGEPYGVSGGGEGIRLKGMPLRMTEGQLSSFKGTAVRLGLPVNTFALIGLRWAVAHISEIDEARRDVRLFGDARDLSSAEGEGGC